MQTVFSSRHPLPVSGKGSEMDVESRGMRERVGICSIASDVVAIMSSLYLVAVMCAYVNEA